jgi:hypothetical protein
LKKKIQRYQKVTLILLVFAFYVLYFYPEYENLYSIIHSSLLRMLLLIVGVCFVRVAGSRWLEAGGSFDAVLHAGLAEPDASEPSELRPRRSCSPAAPGQQR